MAVWITKKHVLKTHVKLLWALRASTKPKPRAGIAQRGWRAPLSILSQADSQRPAGPDIGWNKVGSGGFCKLGAAVAGRVLVPSRRIGRNRSRGDAITR